MSNNNVFPFWQYCSDNEDLFGDYDSILNDSSFLAKLDDTVQNERQDNFQCAPHTEPVDKQDADFTTFQLSRVGISKLSGDDIFTDSILDDFKDEPLEDLPASQKELQNLEHHNRSKWQEGNKTSTPFKNDERTSKAEIEGEIEDKNERKTLCFPNGRRSMTDQLKRAMLCNAAAPSSVSRTVALKEAVVSEEMNVAMQAMETVSVETTDLGPFYGLPTKVKDLIYNLKGITKLYGDSMF